MDYTILGRTGLKVSVMGVGGGGPSRLGQRAGKTKTESIAIVRQALDAGINFFDTAEGYDTEGIVGQGLQGADRNAVVISTKSHINAFDGSSVAPAGAVVASLEASLRALDTDYVDVFHLHGLSPKVYDHAMAEVVPVLLREKERGRFRHLAVSETAPRDPGHTMLERAVEEPVWEVFMLAFHMMNQNARNGLLQRTQANKVGTLCM